MYIKTKIYTTYIYIMTQIYIYIYISMEQYIGSPNGYFVKDRYFIGIYYQQYQGTIFFKYVFEVATSSLRDTLRR